jgi:hypothetical protein
MTARCLMPAPVVRVERLTVADRAARWDLLLVAFLLLGALLR